METSESKFKPRCVYLALGEPEGGITITTWAVEWLAPGGIRRREPTPEHVEPWLRKRGIPVLWWRLLDPSELPAPDDQRRIFRKAWRLSASGSIEVDMPTAREIHRERIRERRGPLFAALDADYMRADERGDVDEKRRVATLRQHLRDAPADPRIEAATTPEELAAVDPLSDTEERSPRDGRQVR
jgi:hypothetical protein